MHSFWHRLAFHNAPFFTKSLRSLADQIEALEPGPPVLAFPPVFWKDGAHVGAITVKDDSAPIGASVTFLDAKNSPTEPFDVPQWSSSDDTVASVVASDDGKSAEVTIGSPGAAEAATAQITVSSTNEDGSVVTSVGAVTVTSAAAVVGDVEFAGPTA